MALLGTVSNEGLFRDATKLGHYFKLGPNKELIQICQINALLKTISDEGLIKDVTIFGHD